MIEIPTVSEILMHFDLQNEYVNGVENEFTLGRFEAGLLVNFVNSENFDHSSSLFPFCSTLSAGFRYRKIFEEFFTKKSKNSAGFETPAFEDFLCADLSPTDIQFKQKPTTRLLDIKNFPNASFFAKEEDQKTPIRNPDDSGKKVSIKFNENMNTFNLDLTELSIAIFPELEYSFFQKFLRGFCDSEIPDGQTEACLSIAEMKTFLMKEGDFSYFYGVSDKDTAIANYEKLETETLVFEASNLKTNLEQVTPIQFKSGHLNMPGSDISIKIFSEKSWDDVGSTITPYIYTTTAIKNTQFKPDSCEQSLTMNQPPQPAQPFTTILPDLPSQPFTPNASPPSPSPSPRPNFLESILIPPTLPPPPAP